MGEPPATNTEHPSGLVFDMPDDEYRDVRAVSYSGLKRILDCPARYRWEQKNRVEKRAFDFGHIIHAELLGAGLPVHVVDSHDWRSKTAREEAETARASGQVPLLAHEYAAALECVAAVHAHPLAGPMLSHPGNSEASMFWTDERTGIRCKARADRVLETGDGTHWLLDPKTVGRSAQPRAFARDAAGFFYHMQAAFYLDGYEACTGHRARFLNIPIEVKPPHLVSVVEFDVEAVDVGRDRYADALDIYRQCREAGEWPGYTETFAETISLPRWATY